MNFSSWLCSYNAVAYEVKNSKNVFDKQNFFTTIRDTFLKLSTEGVVRMTISKRNLYY